MVHSSREKMESRIGGSSFSQKSTKDIISILNMIGSDFTNGSAWLCIAAEDPTKFSFKDDGDPRGPVHQPWSNTSTKTLTPNSMSIHPGCPNRGSAKGRSDIVSHFRSNERYEQASPTLGIMTAVTSIFLPACLTAEIGNRLDWNLVWQTCMRLGHFDWNEETTTLS